MDTRTRIVVFAFFGAFFAVGLSYWQIPYGKASLPDSIIGVGLFAVAVLAGVSRVVVAVRLWPATLIVGAAVPAAVLARVMYDTAADPTSHNLWPFEIVLSAGPGFVVAWLGAAAGGLLATRRGA